MNSCFSTYMTKTNAHNYAVLSVVTNILKLQYRCANSYTLVIVGLFEVRPVKNGSATDSIKDLSPL